MYLATWDFVLFCPLDLADTGTSRSDRYPVVKVLDTNHTRLGRRCDHGDFHNNRCVVRVLETLGSRVILQSVVALMWLRRFAEPDLLPDLLRIDDSSACQVEPTNQRANEPTSQRANLVVARLYLELRNNIDRSQKHIVAMSNRSASEGSLAT